MMKYNRQELVAGSVYRLHTDNGYETKFLCKRRAAADAYCQFNAILQNVSSGWTLVAHGTCVYEDGSIAWDFSTGGHFE